MPKGTYKWRSKTRTFTSGDKTVSRAKLRQWADVAVESSKVRLEKFATDYANGDVNLAQFRISMGDELKKLHSSMAMMAYGGRKAMSGKSWSRTGAKLRSEYGYLNSFRTELIGKDITTLGPEFINRAKMYADSAYTTYENQVKAREQDAGVTKARRIKESDDRVCNGCEAAATGEFQLIADVLPIGEAECLSKCRCYLEYEAA